jgi:hypothetical protein
MSQPSSLFRHVISDKLYKWPTLPFAILNTTSSLIDFMFFRRQCQEWNSERNTRFCFSDLISCTQLVPVCRLLWWTSLWHIHHNDYYSRGNFGRQEFLACNYLRCWSKSIFFLSDTSVCKNICSSQWYVTLSLTPLPTFRAGCLITSSIRAREELKRTSLSHSTS